MHYFGNVSQTFDRAWLTVGPFWAASYCVVKGVENIQSCRTSESYPTLLKITALQLPIAGVIGAVTRKIFDSFGWQPSENRTFAIRAIASISTLLLMPMAAVRLGLTTSSDTALMVSLATAQFIMGAACVDMGIRNAFFNGTQRPPALIL